VAISGSQFACDLVVGKTCSWISEMRSVEEAVEDALCEEGSDEVTRLENEHPSGEDAILARLAQLQHAVTLQIVAPMLQAFGDAQEQACSRLMLPAFACDVPTLLAKTWHLAQVRGLQVQRLKSSIASLQSKMKAKGMESVSKVNPKLKEKSWELARAQTRMEQLEGDLKKSGLQFRQLERAKHRETSRREECERRLCSLQFDNHRHLSNSKAALQQVKDALIDARDEIERLGEIEASFKICHGQLQKLEQQQPSCRGADNVHASSEACPSSLETCTSLEATPQLVYVPASWPRRCCAAEALQGQCSVNNEHMLAEADW